MPHAFMIGLGKQKGDANLLQQIGCFLWRKGDVDMQCLQVSALPLLLDTPRFPCLATASPAPHNTKEEVVEILKVFRQSPPVPTISTIPFTSVGSGVALLTMTLDAAAISAGLPFHLHCDQNATDLFTACSAIHNDIHGSFHFLCCQIMVFTDLFNIFL